MKVTQFLNIQNTAGAQLCRLAGVSPCFSSMLRFHLGKDSSPLFFGVYTTYLWTNPAKRLHIHDIFESLLVYIDIYLYIDIYIYRYVDIYLYIYIEERDIYLQERQLFDFHRRDLS